MSVGTVKMSDYETDTGKVVSGNKGPSHACCGKPIGQCICPKPADIPGDERGGNPAQRQATALEMIVVHLAKIIKLLEAKHEIPAVFSIPVSPGAGMETANTAILDPAAIIAASEAKKQATIDRMKGLEKK